MDKAQTGCTIGCLAGPVLGFLIVTGVFSGSKNEDMANFAFLYGLLYGLPAGLLIGPVIGALIGALLGWSKGK